MRALRAFRSLGGLLVVLFASPHVLAQAESSARLEEGLRLLKERRYDEAKRALNAAASAQPTSPEPWIGLGNAHLATQSHQEAIGAFEKALSLAPDNDTVRYNLAFALRKGGRPRDAAAAYRRYLDQKPDDADAWYGLAEALREAKDVEAAADAYDAYADREKRPDRQTWVEKARRQAVALRGYADAGTASKPAPAASASAPSVAATTTPAAEAAAEAPITTDRANAALREAQEALQQGRFDAALAVLAPLTEEEQKAPFVAAAFAAAHLGRGDAEAAIRWYRSALVVASSPAKPPLLFGLAEAHRRDGNVSAAREAFSAVVQSEDPNLAELAKVRLAALESR